MAGSREGRAGKSLRSGIRDIAGMVPRDVESNLSGHWRVGARAEGRMTLGPGHMGSSRLEKSQNSPIVSCHMEPRPGSP